MFDYGNDWRHGPWIRSRPIPVFFQGWRSTTQELQAAGWELSVSYDMSNDMYDLAMSNPQLQLVGRTAAPTHISRSLQFQYNRENLPTFYVQVLTHTVKIFYEYHLRSSMAWRRIDAMPQVATIETMDLHDMCHFAPWDKSTEVLVGAADMEVVELLRIIVDKQQPKQQELREKSARAQKIERVNRILEVA